jgi:flagellar hook assembly protein FlgD
MAGVNRVRADVTGGTNPSGTASVIGTTRPETFDTLTKNFLDPKKGETVQVRAEVPAPVRLTIRVFNLAGELVRVVGDAQVQPGVTVWTWDGRTTQGDFAANGTYFIQIVAGKDTQVKRVIILKR